MFTATNLYEKELQKRVKLEIDRVVSNLAAGWQVENFADYKKVVGYLEALRWVDEIALSEVAEIVHERTL